NQRCAKTAASGAVLFRQICTRLRLGISLTCARRRSPAKRSTVPDLVHDGKLADDHLWHLSEVTDGAPDFRFGGQSRLNASIARTAAFDSSATSDARVCCDAQRGVLTTMW